MWASEAKDDSLKYLQQFTTSLAHDLTESAAAVSGRPVVAKRKLEELSTLLARCYYKQGQWQYALQKGVWKEV